VFDLDTLLDFFSPRNLIQLAILWFIVYWTIRYLETTIAGGFLRSVGLIVVVAVIVAMKLFDTFHLDALGKIFQIFILFAFISVVIIFQPEFRHGLTRLGHSPLARYLTRFGLRHDETAAGVVDEIMKAARRFSKNRTGSMVVIEREVSLQPYVDRAVQVDASVRAEMLDTIFSTPTLLHDGAVIVRGSRIEAAGAVLPLTQNQRLPKRYGTRHRAALGITEESDAVVVVTSEETGAISLCYGGEITPQEDIVKTEETLRRLLEGSKEAA